MDSGDVLYACLCPGLREKTFEVDTIKCEACGFLLVFKTNFSVKSWLQIPAPYKPGMVTHTCIPVLRKKRQKECLTLRWAWSTKGVPGNPGLHRKDPTFKQNNIKFFLKLFFSEHAAQLVEICPAFMKLWDWSPAPHKPGIEGYTSYHSAWRGEAGVAKLQCLPSATEQVCSLPEIQ